MNTANVLNVAGSIGGVASAVSDLFGPASGSWEASLVTAKFGGVPFGVNDARTRAGRRQATHEYPYRDEIWVEDQGKQARQFRINGFLIENSLAYGGGGVIAQREALLKVCESVGTKTLIHPTFGTIENVNCLSLEIGERKDLGRVFEFTMVLIISGERKYPDTSKSTKDAVGAAAEKTQLEALADFAKSIATTIQQGAAIVQQAVSTAVGFYQKVIGIINRVKRVFNAVSNLTGSFGRLFGGGNDGFEASNLVGHSNSSAADLLAANAAASAAAAAAGSAFQNAAANIADTDAYGLAATQFVQSVADTAEDPADGISMLAELASYAPTSIANPSAIGLAMSEMQRAQAAYLRRIAIAAMAQVATTYQPSSQDDAVAVQANITTIIDQEILVAADAGDDASYLALRELREAVVADLQARGADLAAVESFSFNDSLPSLTLANRIYRDPSRADDLVRQVDPIHPAFFPHAFRALAN